MNYSKTLKEDSLQYNVLANIYSKFSDIICSRSKEVSIISNSVKIIEELNRNIILVLLKSLYY